MKIFIKIFFHFYGKHLFKFFGIANSKKTACVKLSKGTSITIAM